MNQNTVHPRTVKDCLQGEGGRIDWVMVGGGGIRGDLLVQEKRSSSLGRDRGKKMGLVPSAGGRQQKASGGEKRRLGYHRKVFFDTVC